MPLTSALFLSFHFLPLLPFLPHHYISTFALSKARLTFLLQLITELGAVLLLKLGFNGFGKAEDSEICLMLFSIGKTSFWLWQQLTSFQLHREQCKYQLLKLKVAPVNVQDHDKRSLVYLCWLWFHSCLLSFKKEIWKGDCSLSHPAVQGNAWSGLRLQTAQWDRLAPKQSKAEIEWLAKWHGIPEEERVPAAHRDGKRKWWTIISSRGDSHRNPPQKNVDFPEKKKKKNQSFVISHHSKT